MPTIKFFTKTLTRDKNTLVPVWIRLQAGRGIDYSCKADIYIHSENWSNVTQLARQKKDERVDVFNYRTGDKSQSGRFDFNSVIAGLRSHIESEFMQIRKGDLNYEWLRTTIDKYWRPDKYRMSLFRFIETFVEKSETRINPKTNSPVCYKMRREYERTFGLLKDYASEKKVSVDFRDINLDFYDGFTQFLQEKDLAKNTIGKKIQTLKIFLNAAKVEGFNQYSAYESRNFVSVTEEADTIALSETELEKIYNTDFSSKPHLDRVRDMFLVGCWTGCRFSDLDQISLENISEELLHIRQKKTGADVLIPLHSVVTTIFNKYNGKLPGMISNQKFNDALKLVAEAAELNDPVIKRITKGGTVKTEAFRKHQMVTSHTARRSFATNLYKSGFPSISIMAVTGHRSEKAFLKYIKITPQEHAKKLQMHWNNNI